MHFEELIRPYQTKSQRIRVRVKNKRTLEQKMEKNYESMWNKSSFGFFPLYTKLVDQAHIVVQS
jgi:hypothetical protein